jgi:metallo-beta-lactamase class B
MRNLLPILLLTFASPAFAQPATNAAAKDFYCTPGKAHANAADDPLIEPVKIFDNLYAIGRTTTVVYALTTSEGIALIDAGYADQLESVLLPGMQKLGLDPARIKYVLVTHGHPDHFGGARALQDRYGAKVAASEKDWATIDRPGRGGGPSTGPKKEVVLVDGAPLQVGDTRIDVVAIPGHTPGSLGFVFPVNDGPARHMAGLFGGAILLPGRVADVAGLQGYVASVTHFAEVAKGKGVDVEVQNHPMFDAMDAKLATLKTRSARQPHPFVLGADGYQQFLSTIAGCMNAEIERRNAAAPR